MLISLCANAVAEWRKPPGFAGKHAQTGEHATCATGFASAERTLSRPRDAATLLRQSEECYRELGSQCENGAAFGRAYSRTLAEPVVHRHESRGVQFV